MIRLLIFILSFALVATSSSCVGVKGSMSVPNAEAKAINQISIHKMGCGPASLINAYRCAGTQWNPARNVLQKGSDKEQFDFMVKYYGRVYSRYAHAAMRWDDSNGINGPDLTDLANDFQKRNKLSLPKLTHITHFIKSEQGEQALLRATHKHLVHSLKEGFPPILSVKRVAQRDSRWRQVHGHFVVLYEIPGSLPRDATSFKIKYIDPWGGKIKSGTILISQKSFYAADNAAQKPTLQKSPTLAIDFPYSNLGRHLVKSKERSATILAASITPE